MAGDDRGPHDESDDGRGDRGDVVGVGDRQLAETVAGDPELFLDATAQFYRGEVDRMTAWRTRLDQTTNWAVVLMAAILTFAFSSRDNPHYVLLLGALSVGAFLVIESQRYQEYDAWRYRVRLIQRNLQANLFAPEDGSHEEDWRAQLGADLRKPELSYPRWRAIAHRLKRVYFFLLSVLIVAWGLRISVFDPGETWRQTARIAAVPGPVVVGLVAVVFVVLAALAAWSAYEVRVREFGESSIREG
jgi:uncharacterized membrane protein